MCIHAWFAKNHVYRIAVVVTGNGSCVPISEPLKIFVVSVSARDGVDRYGVFSVGGVQNTTES